VGGDCVYAKIQYFARKTKCFFAKHLEGNGILIIFATSTDLIDETNPQKTRPFNGSYAGIASCFSGKG
jgi:hypothetical protein